MKTQITFLLASFIFIQLNICNYSVCYIAAISQSLSQGFTPCFKAVSIHDLRVA